MTKHKALTSTRRLEGLSVLVVEDETMVALLIEDMLLELGCRQVRHASGVEMAMTSLRERRPDLAMLDVNLNRELVFPVATWLQEAGIPFIFATGYGGPTIPGHLASQPLLQKPFTVEALEAALSGELDNDHGGSARTAAVKRRG